MSRAKITHWVKACVMVLTLLAVASVVEFGYSRFSQRDLHDVNVYVDHICEDHDRKICDIAGETVEMRRERGDAEANTVDVINARIELEYEIRQLVADSRRPAAQCANALYWMASKLADGEISVVDVEANYGAAIVPYVHNYSVTLDGGGDEYVDQVCQHAAAGNNRDLEPILSWNDQEQADSFQFIGQRDAAEFAIDRDVLSREQCLDILYDMTNKVAGGQSSIAEVEEYYPTVAPYVDDAANAMSHIDADAAISEACDDATVDMENLSYWASP